MNIEELRREIDKTDEIIVNAFLRRLSLCREIGQYKKENSIPVKDESREAEILEKLKEMSGGDGAAVTALYEKIFEISRESQS